jgi:hypothetical protein
MLVRLWGSRPTIDPELTGSHLWGRAEGTMDG